MEFLGRPNLPNALANSLVQLAAAESNPMAEAFKQVGGLADKFTAYQMESKLQEKKDERDEVKAGKQHDRAKELKKMDQDAAIFDKLLSNDRIVGGLIGDKGMSRADADGLLTGVETPGAKTRKSVEGDFGKQAQGEGTPLSEFGVNIPGNPRVTPSKEKVKIDAGMAKRFGLPDTVIGKTLTMDQVVAMRRSESSRSGVGGRDPHLEKMAEKIADESLEPDASIATRLAAVDAAYKALGAMKEGKSADNKVTQAAQDLIDADAAARNKPKTKKGFSIFGFGSGGEAAKEGGSAGPTSTEESIRAEYQSGKLTKDQVKEKIKALRAPKK